MKKIGLIFVILSILPRGVFAQEELFIQNDDIVEKVAEDAAKSRARGDRILQDYYMSVILDAFREYWSSTDSQSTLSADSLDRLRLDVAKLIKQKTALNDTIKLLNSVIKKNQDNETVRQQIEDLSQRKQKVSQEIDSIDFEIVGINSKYEKLAPEIDKINKSQQVLDEKKDEVKILADAISELDEKCRNSSLLETQLSKEIESSLKSFEEKRRLMENFDPSLAEKTSEKVLVLNNYLLLSNALQNSVSQMGGHYDGQKNLTLVNSINETMGALKKLSKAQEYECEDIVAALSNQGDAFQYYSDFLKWFEESTIVIPDIQSRAETKSAVEEKLKTDESLLSTFSRYYTGFQKVQQKLLEDMSPSSSLPIREIDSEDKFKKYVDGLRKML